VFLLTAGSEMRTWAGPKYSSLYVYLTKYISLLTAASQPHFAVSRSGVDVIIHRGLHVLGN
jgi:hypothetical protein